MGIDEERARRDARREIEAHLRMRTEDLEREGLSRAEARARAELEFGDVEDAVAYLGRRNARREARATRAGMWVALARDVRLMLRSFVRRPLVPVLVVLTLAVGIGANTAVYSLVDALVFRPLPFGEGDRVVRMRDATVRPDGRPWPYNTSARSYHILRESGVFASITAQRYHLFHLTGDGEPLSVTGIGVSADWMETLRVEPALGRDFTPAEERAGWNARVVVLGHGLWERHYGGDRRILGQSVTLNGAPYTVVGVMPARFNYPYGSQLWVPDTFDPSDAASGPNVAARMRAGESLAGTQVALDALSRRAAEAFPESHRSIRFLAVPQRDDLLGNQPRLGWVLFGAVAFLLLIATANLANLLLARSVAARRERALHTALGASRWDHARRLLMESSVLALIGGGLGVMVAAFLLEPMAALSVPPDGSLGAFFTDLRLDRRVLGFAALATVGTTLLFGVAPALRTWRGAPMSDLRDGDRAGDRTGIVRGALVVGEIALAVVLLSGATLLVQDYARLQGADPGYEAKARWVVSLALPEARYEHPVDRLAFLREVVEEVEALPGVEGVSWVNHLPVSDGSVTRPITAENGPASEPDTRVLSNLRVVGPGYFGVMGMDVAQGRVPTPAESRDAARVVVLSESAARHYWPAQDPVGRMVRVGLATQETPWFTVVGVLSQVREEWELDDTWYVPATGEMLSRAWLVVRARTAVSGMPGQLREAVWQIDADQPIERVVLLPELVLERYRPERLGTRVVGTFATVGLLLSILGIYGVTSYTVSRSTRAMGIRLALGARPAEVKGLVLRRGAARIAAGLAIGGGAAHALTRLLSGFVAADGRLAVTTLARGGDLGLPALAAVMGVLGGVALLACYVPARRADGVDPAKILKED
ncbi:MAG: ABC transporter permease [Gemmatimonadota bacterium]|jgi:predicted permease